MLTYTLADIDEAYELFENKRDGVIVKVRCRERYLFSCRDNICSFS